ncbi:sulfotransferase [bacterium]|nr:sulfotransferase [bacterium]
MNPFFVMGLPRSGSTWLANFLTWGDAFCYHELAYGCESLDDMEKAFKKVGSKHIGTCDTGGVFLWDMLAERWPGAKFLFVVRPIEDVRQSLNHAGFGSEGLNELAAAMSAGCRCDRITSATIPYDKLFSQHGLRQIWNFFEFDEAFPWRRFELLREMNIQDISRSNPEREESEDKMDMSMYRFGKLLESTQPPQQQSFG